MWFPTTAALGEAPATGAKTGKGDEEGDRKLLVGLRLEVVPIEWKGGRCGEEGRPCRGRWGYGAAAPSPLALLGLLPAKECAHPRSRPGWLW